MKQISRKELTDIADEWSKTCHNRHTAVLEGKDISLIHVIVPTILQEIKNNKYNHLLDVGCGTGYLTHQMSKYVQNCVGIDASKNSIILAKQTFSNPNLKFIQTSMKDYVPSHTYDICVSSMALTCDPDYSDTLMKINQVLPNRGILLIMITHPCFWPLYWKLNRTKWFDYSKEQYIEHNYSISLVKSMGKATFIHRSLQQYYNAIQNAGFSIIEMIEPQPFGKIPNEYKYDYPRFLFFKCIKAS